MALRPWVKRLINEALEFELFDVDDGRRYQPQNHRQRLQDMIPDLNKLWQDWQEMEQWMREKFDEIDQQDLADEEKIQKLIQVMYLACAAATKAYGESDIPTLDEFRDMIRQKFAARGILI